MRKLYDQMLENINNNKEMSEFEKRKIMEEMLKMSENKANILITGATGSGKSSTINALFGIEKAEVGTGADPQTMSIAKYDYNGLTLWDSPGLGDGPEADKRHAEGIIKKLTERDADGNFLIDVVLVILDGSSRDLGTSFELIEKVIAPCIGKNDKCLLVAINQADIAMKGKHWDSENHKPDETLAAFLKEKEKSVHDRILNGCGISVDPISYSAGYKEEGCPQEPSYNMAKLLYYIIDSIPEEKRLQTYLEANADQNVWQSNDAEDYAVKIQQKLGWKHTMKSTAEGAALGAAIGSVIPVIGTGAGAIAGAVIGFLGSFFD